MLYRHFFNYEYRLSNSFVYSWESDFFAMSKSGYFVEVEIKISRGDFFRDFDKGKHKLFNAHHEKRSHYISSTSGRGDFICSFQYGKLAGIDRALGISRWGVRHNGKYGYWVNDNNDIFLRPMREEIYAPATRINFHETSKIKCPNQLYFAVPRGLITLGEIPSYAGLIYCDHYTDVIRRAPYLHKNKQDMTKELLKKFYHLWEYKTTDERKVELSGQMTIFNQQSNISNDRKNASFTPGLF